MSDRNYRLRYLPLFYEDLEGTVKYIAEKLKNPKAASDLLDKVEAAILERLPIAAYIPCGGIVPCKFGGSNNNF